MNTQRVPHRVPGSLRDVQGPTKFPRAPLQVTLPAQGSAAVPVTASWVYACAWLLSQHEALKSPLHTSLMSRKLLMNSALYTLTLFLVVVGLLTIWDYCE